MTEFRILTVCTGNICRSPAAAQLLARGLALEIDVSSAGTGAVVGNPVEPAMQALLEDAGVAVQPFAARQLDAGMVRDADLLLALTTQHRSEALRLAPAALRRSFTLLEFARIVGAEEFPELRAAGAAARLREMTTMAGARRQVGSVVNDDNVPDPYRQGEAVFQSAFEMIRHGVDAIVRVAMGR